MIRLARLNHRQQHQRLHRLDCQTCDRLARLGLHSEVDGRLDLISGLSVELLSLASDRGVIVVGSGDSEDRVDEGEGGSRGERVGVIHRVEKTRPMEKGEVNMGRQEVEVRTSDAEQGSASADEERELEGHSQFQHNIERR